MHARRVQRAPDVDTLADTITLNSLQGHSTFGGNTVGLLVGSLKGHMGWNEILKLTAVAKHMYGAAGINNARFKLHVVRNVGPEEVGRLILQTDRTEKGLATERLMLDRIG